MDQVTKDQLDDLKDWIHEIHHATIKQGFYLSADDRDVISKAWHLLDGLSERVYEEAERSADWELMHKDAAAHFYATRGKL